MRSLHGCRRASGRSTWLRDDDAHKRSDRGGPSLLEGLERWPAFEEVAGLSRSQRACPPERLRVVGLEPVGQTLYVLRPLIDELAPVLGQQPQQTGRGIV